MSHITIALTAVSERCGSPDRFSKHEEYGRLPSIAFAERELKSRGWRKVNNRKWCIMAPMSPYYEAVIRASTRQRPHPLAQLPRKKK